MEEKVIHIINDPKLNALTAPELKLYRPKISYPKAVGFVVLHIFIAFAITYAFYCIKDHFDFSAALMPALKHFWITTFVLFIITSRVSCIWFVRLYQRYAKSETRLRCCMTPSCSEYSILAFKKYGTIIGGIKTFRRLLRCHPPGGVDYP